MSDSLFISSLNPTVLIAHNGYFLVHHPAGVQLLFLHDRTENVYVCYGFLKKLLSPGEIAEIQTGLRTGRYASLRDVLHLDMEIITSDTEKLLALADVKAWTRARATGEHAFPTRLFVEERVTDESERVYARFGFTPVTYTSLSYERHGFTRTYATAVEATGSASVLGIYGKNCTISWKQGKTWTNVTNLHFLGNPALAKKYYARRFWGFDSQQSQQQTEPRPTKAHALWGMRRSVSGPKRAVRSVEPAHDAGAPKADALPGSPRVGRDKRPRQNRRGIHRTARH